MGKLRVLHLIGIDDTGTVKVRKLRATIDGSHLTYVGNVELKVLMQSDDIQIHTLLRGGMAIDGVDLPPVDVVVNAVCDCDTNEGALLSAADVIRQIGRPVINDPTLVLRTGRDSMAEWVGDIEGVHVPRTLRIQPQSRRDVADLIRSGQIRTPFLFREAGAHGGHQLELVRGVSDDELQVLDKFALDGRSYYATEFVDFASPDGRYRKYRVIVIGGRPFPRHLIISDSWNVHAESRRALMEHSPELRAEEERHMRGFDPAEWPVFERLWERLRLDYFGIDFSVRPDGSLVVFEINCCCRPLIPGLRLGEHHDELIAAMERALQDLLFERAGVTRDTV